MMACNQHQHTGEDDDEGIHGGTPVERGGDYSGEGRECVCKRMSDRIAEV